MSKNGNGWLGSNMTDKCLQSCEFTIKREGYILLGGMPTFLGGCPFLAYTTVSIHVTMFYHVRTCLLSLFYYVIVYINLLLLFNKKLL